jgi:hypothetical protein
MDLLFPIMTIFLIVLGAFCLFISMDNRSRLRGTKVLNPGRSAYSAAAFLRSAAKARK